MFVKENPDRKKKKKKRKLNNSIFQILNMIWQKFMELLTHWIFCMLPPCCSKQEFELNFSFTYKREAVIDQNYDEDMI